MKNTILLLFLSCLSVFGQTQPPTVSGRGGAGFLATNSAAINAEGIVFWDDFNSTTPLNNVQFLQRRSPSGHAYSLVASPVANSNGLLMANGRLQQTNIGTTAIYFGVTNNGPRPWNRVGGVFRYYTNPPSIIPPYSAPAILTWEFPDFSIASTRDWLHMGVDASGQIIVQRGIAGALVFEDLIRDFADGNIYFRDSAHYDTFYFTNCIVTTVNGYVASCTMTNGANMYNTRCPVWEINGSYTNTVHVNWDSIWAGYAPVEMELLARTMGVVGTNGASYQNFTTAAFVGVGTGSFTNQPTDTIVLCGNSALRTNKLVTIGTKNVGIEITIIDTGKTGSGSNIWIVPVAGEVINGGAPLTNINTDGGSMTLLSTPNGWYVKAKF